MTNSNTLLLGIGNTLLTDEGAGVHALNLFKLYHSERPGMTYVDGGTLSFTLASYIEDCSNLVVLDAAELKAAPGTVATMEGAQMDAFLAKGRRSPHEVGLLDLLDIARLTGTLPARRALVGIQPGCMDWGMAPSDPVRKALTTATRAVEELLDAWERRPVPGRAVA